MRVKVQLGPKALGSKAQADELQTLNDILHANQEVTDEPYLWLADTYDTLADYDPSNPPEGTRSTVDNAWRSPFIGLSLQEIADFIKAAPKPPKPLCKRHFAVLEKKRYEQDKKLLVYKIPETWADGEDVNTLQSVPCPVHLAGHFFISFHRGHWKYAVRDQAFHYDDGALWGDHSPCDQVMALFVLDEMPKAVRDASVLSCVSFVPADNDCRSLTRFWTKTSKWQARHFFGWRTRTAVCQTIARTTKSTVTKVPSNPTGSHHSSANRSQKLQTSSATHPCHLNHFVKSCLQCCRRTASNKPASCSSAGSSPKEVRLT